jgi:hypothetical protein
MPMIGEGLSGAAAIPALDLTDDEAFALAEQRRQALHYPLALRTKQMVPTVGRRRGISSSLRSP